MTKFILAFLILLSSFKIAAADIAGNQWRTTGFELLAMCKDADKQGSSILMGMQCVSYIRGAVNGIEYQAKRDGKCAFNIPKGVTEIEVHGLIMSWVVLNPQLAILSPAELIIEKVLAQQYPCT